MTGEEVVRRYLQFLDDPSKLVDPRAVDALESRLATLSDPVERLRVLAEIERANRVDGSGVEESFIRQAREWAESEGIPASAFRHLGVPEDVLVRAGLAESGRRRRTAGRATTSRGRKADGARRSPWTSTEAITTWVLATGEPFTLADVQRGAGGSPATIRKAIDDLVAGGRVERLGPATGTSGRGRAPIRYALVR